METTTTTTKINSADHGIEGVTVYQCNRAAIQRRFTVEFKAGQNEIVIEHLPTLLESDSIRVEVEALSEKQSLTVFDVVYSPPNLQNTERDAKVAELEKLKASLKARRYVCKDQVSVLASYSRSLSGKDTPAADLLGYLDTYASKRHEIQGESTRLKEELEKVDKELAAVLQSGINVAANAKRAATVKVVLVASNDISGDIVLSYLVPNANWHSVYDLRAEVDSNLGSKSGASTITLEYRASIMQQTSEDWKDVALTLSTASPLTGSAIPVLNTRYISLGRTRSYKSTFGSSFSSSRPPGTVFPTSGPGFPSSGYDATVGFKSAVASDGFVSNKSASQDLPFYSSGVHPLPSVAMPRRSRRSSSTSSIDGPQQDADQERTRRSRSRNRTVSPHEFVRVPLSGLATTRMVTATEGTISSTFDIEGLSTIPSDDSYHRVSIASLDLTASLEWVCVPSVIPSAFLQCQVRNTSNYVLLAGASNVFMDGNFVAKSVIPDVSPQETFSCSLGVDRSIRVTYHPAKRVVRKTGGIMSSKSEVTTFSQRISIKNTRSRPLSRLIVKDQVPISQDSRLRVSLIQPSEKDVGPPNLPPSSLPSGSISISKSSSSEASSSKTQLAQISKGVTARWAQKHEDGGGWGGAKGDGIIEWICSDVVGTLDVDLISEVSAPQDEIWN